MKKSVIGFIFSIIAAFIYIIALIIIITVVDIRRGGSGAEPVVVLSAASVILALAAMKNNIKAENEENSLKTISMIISDVVTLMGVGTATIFSLELWG